MKKPLLLLNCIMLSIGTCGPPLQAGLYLNHGGKRLWLFSWLQSAGFPLFLIPLTIAYFHRRKTYGPETNFFSVSCQETIVAAALGILYALQCYCSTLGSSLLPVSTSTLVAATQFAFADLFAYVIVKQKISIYRTNAIVLLTLGAGVLAVRVNGDRSTGESIKTYFLGFMMSLSAAALYGIVPPLLESTYTKAKKAVTYSMVLEMQMIMCFSANVFCTVAMIVNKDFQAISREAKQHEFGEYKYYHVLGWTVIAAQFAFLGDTGVIFCASSSLSVMIMSPLLLLTAMSSVILNHENFEAVKGVSAFISLWGFVSYFYGEMDESKKKKIQSTPQSKISIDTVV